jgi:magnesium-transporting ATPase (P-type)
VLILSQIKCKEQIPADILLIQVIEAGKKPETCFVETKNLDGETNLKSKAPPSILAETIHTESDLHVMEGYLECETPNKFTNKFTGSLHMTRVPQIKGAEEYQCSVEDPKGGDIKLDQVLLRGSTLQSGDYIYGLVINTGIDTKIMQSMAKPQIKNSTVDKEINGLICWVLVMLLVLCLVGTVGNTLWNTNYLPQSWYLMHEEFEHPNVVKETLITFFYYMLMASQFIAVSLYVSMNFVKFIQRYFMQQDIEMYHDNTDTPMQVRTMNLNEELGMITHVFSDKTGKRAWSAHLELSSPTPSPSLTPPSHTRPSPFPGTLTDNVMDFRKCSINGKAYGRGSTEIGIARLRREGKLDQIRQLEEHAEERERNKQFVRPVPYVNFDSPEMIAALKGQHGKEQQDMVFEFFLHLALCHTVVVDYDEPRNIKISASSPDESALVAGAIFVGSEFKSKIKDVVTVSACCCCLLYMRCMRTAGTRLHWTHFSPSAVSKGDGDEAQVPGSYREPHG